MRSNGRRASRCASTPCTRRRSNPTASCTPPRPRRTSTRRTTTRRDPPPASASAFAGEAEAGHLAAALQALAFVVAVGAALHQRFFVALAVGALAGALAFARTLASASTFAPCRTGHGFRLLAGGLALP